MISSISLQAAISRFVRVTVILVFLAAIPTTMATALPSPPNLVRVALLKGVETVRISGTGLLALDAEGEPVDAAPLLVLKRGRDGVLVNGRNVRALRVSAPGSLQVNGKGYRGVIEVTPGEKGLQLVDELPLEDYLIGLINCEISSQWPIETIKAQAVIARSYALYQMEARKYAPYHLESSVMDQVYDGSDIEDSRAARGVKETAGQVLTFNGKIIQAFYHSNCGGHTEAAENVWGYPVTYLQGVECKYCSSSAGAVKWEHAFALKKLESLLKSGGVQISGLKDIRPGKKNRSGRLNDVMLVCSRGAVTVSAVNFRKAVGYSVIKSTNFDVRTIGDQAFIAGFGYGHGVGLCQWGAKQRAEDGFNYQEILSYYYPGTALRRISSEP